MNDFYSMVLENMKFSYSSVNSFLTCALGFKYSYLEVEDRMGNAFADFGSFCHKILEKYFKDELEVWDLTTYYQEKYAEAIKCSFPSFPPGMAENYYNQGLNFFDNFTFDKSKYEIIGIEEKLETKFGDINLTIIPDLVLKDIETDEYILYDYKTANLFTKAGKVDKKKLEDIKKQMSLYVYFFWYIKGIEITKVKIWAIRNNKLIEYDYDPVQGAETLEWFTSTIEKIKKEEEWSANTSESYFCNQICSSRSFCPFLKTN